MEYMMIKKVLLPAAIVAITQLSMTQKVSTMESTILPKENESQLSNETQLPNEIKHPETIKITFPETLDSPTKDTTLPRTSEKHPITIGENITAELEYPLEGGFYWHRTLILGGSTIEEHKKAPAKLDHIV